MLAEYIQYNFTILKIFIPQPCIQGGGGAIAIWAIPKYWRVNLIGASLMNNPLDHWYYLGKVITFVKRS